jgi:hypothetical protein
MPNYKVVSGALADESGRQGLGVVSNVEEKVGAQNFYSAIPRVAKRSIKGCVPRICHLRVTKIEALTQLTSSKTDIKVAYDRLFKSMCLICPLKGTDRGPAADSGSPQRWTIALA